MGKERDAEESPWKPPIIVSWSRFLGGLAGVTVGVPLMDSWRIGLSGLCSFMALR